MEMVSPIMDIVLLFWGCAANHNSPIRHLKENLNSLRLENHKLKCIGEDVKQSVELEEKHYKVRTNQVKTWLENVEVLMKEVDEILQKGNQEIQRRCFGSCFPRNCYFSYKIGKEVIKKIDAVKETIKEKHFNVLAHRLPLPPVDEIPMEKTVGMDSKLSQVWRCVEDNSVAIIGIYGMGVIGKTTVLKKLYNKFNNKRLDFDVVIWLTVSKEVNLENIQEVLRKKLQIPNEIWNESDEQGRVARIFNILKSKKFVLLLDDLWKCIDLSQVGIPSLIDDQNGSKVIFTSRSEEVCNSMGIHRSFRVECLSPEAALELFRHKVTEDVLKSHHDIPKLAEIVAKECKGLPLALITIGRAMASRWRVEEWKHAINVLQSYPSKFKGMGDFVFPILKFSYDSLRDNTLKNCFLYCSMLPDDYKIRKDELIELWIAEGFLYDYGSLDDARNEGEYIIGSLRLACLLERVGDSEDYIKMHDVLRDMALWIASETESKILVYENDVLTKQDGNGRWQEAVRVSLWGQKIEVLSEITNCPRLVTFLAKDTYLDKFPKVFFQSMFALKVLDLQGNLLLTEIPEVSKLINLQYLNLSETMIKDLPIEVSNLKQLRILLLDGIMSLKAIPKGLISSLSSLQVFSRLSSPSIKWYLQNCYWDTGLLEELECLEHIKEVGFTLFTLGSIHKIKSSLKLQSCVKRLIINCSELPHLDISRLSTMSSSYFQNLHDLYIENSSVKDLTCLTYAPRLRFVFACSCYLLEEVIACDFGSSEIGEDLSIFQHLKQLNFSNLPCLKSICSRVLPFPSLEKIYVHECPNLRKLPLGTRTSASINGDQEWWDQLEWEDEATKHVLSSKFSSNSCNFKGEATKFGETKFDLGSRNLHYYLQKTSLQIQRKTRQLEKKNLEDNSSSD